MGLRTLAAHAIALCTPAVQLSEAPRRRSAEPAVCEDERDEDMSGVESNDSRCASERRRRMRSADSRAWAPCKRSMTTTVALSNLDVEA